MEAFKLAFYATLGYVAAVLIALVAAGLAGIAIANLFLLP